MTNPAVDEKLDTESRTLKSLVEFRREFIPAAGDVKGAPFHDEWSGILLNGKGHFAIEAFRESAKTQIVIRANLLHALAYPKERRSYIVIICATQTTAGKRLKDVSRDFQASKELSKLAEKVIEDSERALLRIIALLDMSYILCIILL